MAGIKDLGESLLARAKQTNADRYNKSKNDAYRIAFLTAGADLINQSIKQHAVDFLSSEQAMAEKAKYISTVNKAQEVTGLYDTIRKAGKTPEQYFFEQRYLPMMEEQYKATYGQMYVPESYQPMLRDQAMELAKKDAADFNNAYNLASKVPDMKGAMDTFNQTIVPPTNMAAAAVEKVKGFFSGKTDQDFRNEAIQKADRNKLLTSEDMRSAFDKVSNTHGVEEAINFVKSMNTMGLRPNVVRDVKVELHPSLEGQKWTAFTIVTNKNPNTGQVEGDPDIRHSTYDIATDLGKKSLIKSLIEKSDLGNMLRTGFTPEGQAQVNKVLQDQHISPYSISDEREWKTAASVMSDVAKNPQFVKDDVSKQAMATVLQGVVQTSSDLIKTAISEDKKNGKSDVDTLSHITSTLLSTLDNYDNIVNLSKKDNTVTIPTSPVNVNGTSTNEKDKKPSNIIDTSGWDWNK